MSIDSETGNAMSVRDITHYGASIVRAKVPSGTRYWKIVDAYHLPGQQNKGNHTIFVDMLNADGSRRNGAHCNMFVGDKVFTNTIDKPANEPGTNFPMFRGPRYDVEGADMPSDRAMGFTIDLPDEEVGNTNGHHSFMLIFQEAAAGGTDGATSGTIRGMVSNGAGRNITLSGNNVNVTGVILADGSFGFDNVAPGTYTLAVTGTSVATSVTVSAGQQANVNLSVPPPPPPGDVAALQQQLAQLQSQITQLQQQLAQANNERAKLNTALAQIKQALQNAGI